ncbi:uncharacterized protein LOC116261197 [Nymphaea colorata]|uniref:DUF241 domain-containing protein n=1 Tax=Nymphaea colorata TaxID=210225 RepID=A0A5K1GV79_9MAGN|nr:uncharacterized protein LOC116261197 [Nymphaea colorata]
MATSSSNSFHARSISLPTSSNPILRRVEECLEAAKEWQAKPHSLTSTGLGHLKDLFCCIDGFLQMAHTQQALCRKDTFVTQLMDDFLRLLDVCGMVKDSVQRMREEQQALQSMFRRRDQNLDVGIGRYQCMRKSMRKDMIKCLQLLKTMEADGSSTNDSKVEKILRDVRANTVATFEQLASIISARNSLGSIFSKLRCSKKHDGGGAEGKTNEIERLDVIMFALCGHPNKELAEDSVQYVKRLMENLESCLTGVEDELEGVFRSLITARAALLNFLTCC